MSCRPSSSATGDTATAQSPAAGDGGLEETEDVRACEFESSVRYHKTGFWPARFSSLEDLDDVYADWRDRTARPRRHATGRFVVGERLAVEREALRPLPPAAFDAAGRRSSRVPLDGYLKHACRSRGRRRRTSPST
jgi:hypothetical protein